MKFIIAADKFKGSLNCFEACEAIKKAVIKIFPESTITVSPMADGGDGFAAVMKYYLQTETVHCDAADPLGRKISSCYEWDAATGTAVIEMAAASGLWRLLPKERNPLHTSSFGTGMMIQHAIKKGARQILLGLGGSATNDAGAGILAALGFRFIGKDGDIVAPVGASLSDVIDIVQPAHFSSCSFVLACDVDNPLYGKNGAAYVFAPQKGADEISVSILDEGLQDYASKLKEKTGRDITLLKGAGAAGGVAASLAAYFPVQTIAGAQLVASCAGIENHIGNTDMLITGEGRLDASTINGKVAGYIGSLGKKYKVPVLVVCGETDLPAAQREAAGITHCISLLANGLNIEDAMQNTAAHVESFVSTFLAKRRAAQGSSSLE